MTSTRRVFISYSRKDHDLAHAIATALQDAGQSVFIDSRIPIGTDWSNHLKEEILKADFFILLLSPNSVDSRYVQAEIQFASESLEKRNVR